MKSILPMIILLLLTVGSNRIPLPKAQEPQPQQLKDNLLMRLRRWRGTRFLSRVLTLFLALGTFEQAFAALFGCPPWPVDPEIHPHDSTNGTSLILPFVVRNTGQLFPMKNVQFRCGVDMIWAQDSVGGTILIRDAAFTAGAGTVPVGGAPLNLPCNARDLLTANRDGSFSMHGSSTVLESRTKKVFYPPLKIVKMCLWIGGYYKIFGILPWSFTSIIFQWPAVEGSNQWLEGEVASETPDEMQAEYVNNFVPGALKCSDSVRYPYSLVEGPGPMRLVLPAPDPITAIRWWIIRMRHPEWLDARAPIDPNCPPPRVCNRHPAPPAP